MSAAHLIIRLNNFVSYHLLHEIHRFFVALWKYSATGRGCKWRMTSMKPSNCTDAGTAASQRRHMPINLTTSSSSHQQFNKEGSWELHRSTYSNLRDRKLFRCLKELKQTGYLTASSASALNAAPLGATFQQSQPLKENAGRLPLKVSSPHNVASLQIQIESVPRHWLESYFYESENPLRKLGSSSKDTSVTRRQSCRESDGYAHSTEEKPLLIPLHI